MPAGHTTKSFPGHYHRTLTNVGGLSYTKAEFGNLRTPTILPTGTGAVCLVVLTTRMELLQQSDTQEEHSPDTRNRTPETGRQAGRQEGDEERPAETERFMLDSACWMLDMFAMLAAGGIAQNLLIQAFQYTRQNEQGIQTATGSSTPPNTAVSKSKRLVNTVIYSGLLSG